MHKVYGLAFLTCSFRKPGNVKRSYPNGHWCFVLGQYLNNIAGFYLGIPAGQARSHKIRSALKLGEDVIPGTDCF
jgi:hypothetical protein